MPKTSDDYSIPCKSRSHKDLQLKFSCRIIECAKYHQALCAKTHIHTCRCSMQRTLSLGLESRLFRTTQLLLPNWLSVCDFVCVRFFFYILNRLHNHISCTNTWTHTTPRADRKTIHNNSMSTFTIVPNINIVNASAKHMTTIHNLRSDVQKLIRSGVWGVRSEVFGFFACFFFHL